MEEKVFAVKFECENCGAEWEEKFCRGDKVEEQFLGIYVQDHRCTGEASCLYCRHIECPVCGRRDDVLIKERYPLKKVTEDDGRKDVNGDGTTYRGYD